MRLSVITNTLFIIALAIVQACKKGSAADNLPPETYISLDTINLQGDNRLNSQVTLHWWGSDPDGVIAGYEISLDQKNWAYTENQDSNFTFSITAGSDTVDIQLYVRAIDLEGLKDDSPAHLRIPLKNTPPEIEINQDLVPEDTAFIALTLTWTLSDLDGFSTIKNVEIKINDADWLSISPHQSFVCIVPVNPETSGSGMASIYFEDGTLAGESSGLNVFGKNSVYIRASDIAGSFSKEDTLADIYVRGKVNDLLVIGANGASPNAFYKSNLNAISEQFDFIDFVRSNAKNQPKIWNPTFKFMLKPYNKVLFYSNDQTFTNAQTNAEAIILEFASTAILDYLENGGKLWLNSSFPNAFNTGSALFGILPIDSFSSSVGQARLPIDSTVYSSQNYPELVCSAFISGLDPFYPSSDALVIQNAHLTKNNGWNGPTIVGVRRQTAGKTNFVFQSVELHKLNQNPSAVQDLFDHVLHQEFNW